MQPTILVTIAGSDSGGGAGIQGDIRTCEAMDVFAMTVVTAVTAQNAQGVHHVHPIDVTTVEAQLDALTSGFEISAVKTGMLASAEIVEMVGSRARDGMLPNLVVDPVLVSSSGRQLVTREGVVVYRSALLPFADVVTPNWMELAALTGQRVENLDDAACAGKALRQLGPKVVVVTGGGSNADVVITENDVRTLSAAIVETRNAHGTGCAFSTAIASHLALGFSPLQAIVAAKQYVCSALSRSSDWEWPGFHGSFGRGVVSDPDFVINDLDQYQRSS